MIIKFIFMVLILTTSVFACDEIWWGSAQNDEIRINDRGEITVVRGSFHSRSQATRFDFRLANCVDLGAGDDKFYLYIGQYQPLIVYGREGSDLIITGGGDDTVYGGPGHDSIYTGRGNDHLYGGTGRDDLNGEDGDDYLNGGDQNDVLRGGPGDDTLIGGKGSDDLNGNSGRDNFVEGPGCDSSDINDDDDDQGRDGSFFAELFASCV